MIKALSVAVSQQKSQVFSDEINSHGLKNSEIFNRSHCLPTATWAMLSFVGIFQPKPKKRRPANEQDQDCQTRTIPPRTTL